MLLWSTLNSPKRNLGRYWPRIGMFRRPSPSWRDIHRGAQSYIYIYIIYIQHILLDTFGGAKRKGNSGTSYIWMGKLWFPMDFQLKRQERAPSELRLSAVSSLLEVGRAPEWDGAPFWGGWFGHQQPGHSETTNKHAASMGIEWNSLGYYRILLRDIWVNWINCGFNQVTLGHHFLLFFFLYRGYNLIQLHDDLGGFNDVCFSSFQPIFNWDDDPRGLLEMWHDRLLHFAGDSPAKLEFFAPCVKMNPSNSVVFNIICAIFRHINASYIYIYI